MSEQPSNGQHANFPHPNPARAAHIQAQAEAMTPLFAHPAPERLNLSIQLVNQILNEKSHRPDAVRLLREILRERAIYQKIKNWDSNSLFG